MNSYAAVEWKGQVTAPAAPRLLTSSFNPRWQTLRQEDYRRKEYSSGHLNRPLQQTFCALQDSVGLSQMRCNCGRITVRSNRRRFKCCYSQSVGGDSL